MKTLHRNQNRPFNHFFDHVMNDLMTKDNTKFNKSAFSGHKPKVNIIDEDAAFLIEVSAAGYDKKDIEISIDNDLLTISSEKKVKETVSEEKKLKFTRKEFDLSNFKRTFTLPDTVNTEDIQATFKNGIVSISIPKKEEAKPIPKKVIKIA